MLYENFNTTNQTSPHFERHENFVSDAKEPTCALVEFIDPHRRCNYVKSKRQCEEHIYIFNYVHFYYCVLDQSTTMNLIFSVFTLIMLLLFFFTMVFLLADSYFCPSLKVLSRLLGLNENIAGVTLVAFGNASADIFTNLAGLQSESRRIYSDIYGANLFVLMLVGGLIIITEPFVVQPSGLIRDMLFMIFGVIFIEYVMVTDDKVTLAEAITVVAIYFCYYIVIFIDQFLVSRQSKILESQMLEEARFGDYSAITIEQAKYLRGYGAIQFLSIIENNDSEIDIRMISKLERFFENYNPRNPSNNGIFRQFAESFEDAFNFYDFSHASFHYKIWLIIRTPLVVVYVLMMPVVDYELSMNGWSKLLNCMQLVIAPCFLVFGIKFMNGFLDVPYFIWSLLASVPFAVYMFLNTRTDLPPKKHDLFALLTILVATFLMYAAAVEIYAVLTVLGVVTNSSNSFLGCTLLGWGNSIGDLITNLSLSRSGYTRMAFAASIGSPLFNSLMAIGSTFIYRTYTSDTLTYQFHIGTMGGNCYIFHMFMLPALLFSFSTTNYTLRHSIGFMMIGFYALFFAYCFLGEMEIIHPFGTDHFTDLKFDSLYEFN